MKKRNMYRKVVGTVLAGSMLFSLTAASAFADGSASSDASGDVVIMSWDASDAEGMNTLIAEFNKIYPDIHVTFESLPWTDYFTKLTAGAQGGEMPDLFVMHVARFDKFIYGDVLQPLDDILAEEPTFSWDNYPESMVETYTRDGSHYVLPAELNVNALFYNKELFDQAGVAYPAESWTWDEFVETAKALTDEDAGVYGFGARNHSTEGYEAFMYSNGGCVLTPDGKSGFDMPESIEAIQKWRELIDPLKVSPTIEQFSETDLVQRFISGNVAMAVFDCWRAAVFAKDENIAGKFNVATMPVMKNDTTYICSNGWVMPKAAPNPEAAAVFLRWLSTKEAADLFSQNVRASARKGSTELYYTVAGEDVDLELVYEHGIETGTPIPSTRDKDDWSTEQANIMGEILSGAVDVEEGCRQIAAYMNEVIENEKY